MTRSDVSLASDGTDPSEWQLAALRDENARLRAALEAARAEPARGDAPRMGEAHYRSIIESATDFAIITSDLEGRITSWNPGAEKLLGWSEAEAIGQDACMIFTPEDDARGACEREMRTAAGQGRAEDERWHRRKDGSRFWATGLMMRFEREADGAHVGYLKILRDRTARHEAEQRLRESETFARALFESSADCVKTLDLEGGVHSMNGPGLCLMEIEDFSSIAGQDWASLWPEALRDQVRLAVGEARAGRVGRFHGPCPTAKGTPKFWDVQVSPVPGPDGQPQMLLSVSRDVTGRTHDQEALGESEARFRNMADHAPVMMWVTDANGSCTYLNRRWYEFTGQTREEAEGFGWLDATHPEDKAEAGRVFLDANARHQPFRIEYRLRHADGTYRWAIDAASPRFGPAGEFLGYIGSVIDIQERREAEERLAESEARYRTLFESIESGFCVIEVDPGGSGRPVDYRVVEANPAFHRQTGFSAEVLGRWLREAVPALEEHWYETYGRVARSGTPERFEEGSPSLGRWFDVYAFRIGEPEERRVAILFNDISPRRNAEEALRRLNETLEARVAERTAERNQMWALSRDIMLRCGFDGRITAVNPAWTEVLGWREDELVGNSIFDLIHPDDLRHTRDGAQAHAEGRSFERFENRYRHRDGSYRWLSWSTRADADVIIAVGRDVTAEKQQAEALRQAEEQLRQAQKMEAVGQLTGGIAHDFNNLLTGVIGSLDMMQRRLSRGEMDKVERYATAAMTSANRAAALTHRLLAFSRRQPLDPRPVNANRLVTGMEELLRRTIGEAIRLEIVTAGGLWQTLCDPHQLESAILNLAINARDAMPGGGTLTVETCNAHLDNAYAARTRGVRPGQYVCVCVTDTGTGMPPDVVARAFEPFFTTKPIGQGTGLGLSMIYGFARQSEGYAKIYSEVGKGTTFKLYLPRHHGKGEEDEGVAGGLSGEHRAEAGEVVLVVEDETAVRDLVVDVLQELGYRAAEAVDGPSGLKLLQSDMRVDLLVTDVGLPGLNGRQLADAARERRPGLKVLFMTGYAENAAVANGFLAPGMQMITKPFAVEALATRIRDMIEDRATR